MYYKYTMKDSTNHIQMRRLGLDFRVCSQKHQSGKIFSKKKDLAEISLGNNATSVLS